MTDSPNMLRRYSPAEMAELRRRATVAEWLARAARELDRESSSHTTE